jgi:hypothetical protein
MSPAVELLCYFLLQAAMHLFFCILAFLSWDAVGYCASHFCAHVCANTTVEVGIDIGPTMPTASTAAKIIFLRISSPPRLVAGAL